MAEKHVDKRHGDPQHGGLTSGEKAAISRAVHEGTEVHFTASHPEHVQAAEEYRREVEASVRAEKGHGHGQAHGGHGAGGAASGGGHGHQAAGRGELSGAEKAAVTRTVHAGHDVSSLPFTQGHPRKLQHAREYAEEIKSKEGQE